MLGSEIVRRERVEIDGVSTSIISAGDGPTIVLLHGAAFGIDAEATWFRTIEGLSDDFRLISFDQIGFGRTDMPEDGVYKNRLERVDHALAVLDHLGVEDACLIGHSEGAFMAARIAIVEPRLVGSLVLVTTGGTAPYFDDARDGEWIAAAEAAYNDLDKLATEDRFIASGRHLSLTTDSRLESLMRENYHRGIESGQDKLFENLPLAETDYDLYRQLQERYVLPFLADLDVPTLLLWSANDPTVPVERAELLLEYLAEGELVVIEDAAHNVMIDQTDAFNSAVRSFLG
ncbi:MAG: pimeloyl-ACP methyl ester carboxylesterase [Verrucomicrobiales bacterium]|jgi:pimeloyl-ACP methyl ester carboxylesterase